MDFLYSIKNTQTCRSSEHKVITFFLFVNGKRYKNREIRDKKRLFRVCSFSWYFFNNTHACKSSGDGLLRFTHYYNFLFENGKTYQNYVNDKNVYKKCFMCYFYFMKICMSVKVLELKRIRVAHLNPL